MRRLRTARDWVAALTTVGVRLGASALIVLTLLSVTVRVTLQRADSSVRPGHLRPVPTASELREVTAHQERLEAALDVYHVRHGAYPASLEELVLDGLIPNSALRYSDRANPYYYRASGGSFTLHPPRY